MLLNCLPGVHEQLLSYQVTQRLRVWRRLEIPELEGALLGLGQGPQEVGVVGGRVPEAGRANSLGVLICYSVML